jgi:pullulanase/glycogen debranching enzyme
MRLFHAAVVAILLPVFSCAHAAPVRQRAVLHPSPTREWARGAVFYEIFVRSFADSRDDGIGDFNGLTSKLDYLRSDLGVDGIWLMPVFESPSYHGYDTPDYETFNVFWTKPTSAACA